MSHIVHTFLPTSLDQAAVQVLAAYITATAIGSLGAGIVVGWVWARR